MPAFSVAEGQSDLDEGQYEAVVRSIEPALIDLNKPRDPRFDKPQLVVTYLLTEVEAEDGSEITRRQYVNEVAALTPKSTLYGLFSTLLMAGQPLDKTRRYHTDELIGVKCQIFWGSYTGEDGTQKMKILKVSPPRTAAPAGAGGVRRKALASEVDAV